MTNNQPLEPREVEDALGRLPDWQLVDGKLHAEFRFADFVQAFGFMASVALVAESANHHPEWSNVYDRVVFDLVTHEAGPAITERDIELATAISRLAA